MSDRGNQVTLGTFIATFDYCLVVLRTIRGGEDGGFVLQLAVMVGLLLALCSIAVLIYFIHHVPRSIHINNVVAHIGRQLLEAADKRFPAHLGEPLDEDAHLLDTVTAEAMGAFGRKQGIATIHADGYGYIAVFDDDALMNVAQRLDLVLLLHHRPGNYVSKGSPLASGWPKNRIDDEAQRAIRRSYSVGSNRTAAQDIYFLIDELVEIAARALSSGVNDPYTAITCVDWLGAALSQMTNRQMPSPHRLDSEGRVRVIAVPQGFAEYVDRAFGRARQYLARDMNTALHALETLASVCARCTSPSRASTVAAEAEKLTELAKLELHGPALEPVVERHQELRRRFGLEVAAPEDSTCRP